MRPLVSGPAIEEFRLVELHTLLTGRGWVLGGCCPEYSAAGAPLDPHTLWVFPGAFREVRFALVDGASPRFPEVRFVYASTLPSGISVGTAGYLRGCDGHRRRLLAVGLRDEVGLADALTEAEEGSRDLDPREFIECRFFGSCHD